MVACRCVRLPSSVVAWVVWVPLSHGRHETEESRVACGLAPLRSASLSDGRAGTYYCLGQCPRGHSPRP